MRYQILEQGEYNDVVVVDVTNSYAQAVIWAKVGEYLVYDTKIEKCVYNGQLDERL
jgi:hypothetical protein